jgi:hypothetical protein
VLVSHRARMSRCGIGRCDLAHSQAMMTVTLLFVGDASRGFGIGS